MKFYTCFLTLVASAFLSHVEAGALEDCASQAECVDFNITQVDGTGCDANDTDETCHFVICMTITNRNGQCTKNLDTDTISHSCKRDDSRCWDVATGFEEYSTKIEQGIDYGYSECQNVKAGGMAEFMLKDGSDRWCESHDSSAGGGEYFSGFTTGTTAQCHTLYNLLSPATRDLPEYGHCGGGSNNHKKECVWQIPAPPCSPSVPTASGGGGGDPHIKRWNRKSFEFHGECDLVLVQSTHVNGDKPLDLHIRTVIQEWWSQIESAALRVGDVILQVDANKMYLNGQEITDADLPLKTEEFTISGPHDGAALAEAVHGLEMKVLRTYGVHLNDESSVVFKILDNFINVNVVGHYTDFEHATGLMGDFKLGKPYNRKGERLYDLEEFAFEWQVDPRVDPSLFMEVKGPQLPHEHCRMPTVAKTTRQLRNPADLQLHEDAQKACAGKDEYDACMSDIMATGNLNMALIH